MRPAVLALLALSSVACHPRPRELPRDYPGRLVSSEELPREFIARQSVVAHAQGHDTGFDAVLQQHEGVLTMVGLTPFGTRAFLLQQRGVELSFTNFLPREMPFPPRYMLLDVHRALFIGLPNAPLSDGAHVGTRDGEEIREEWAGGRLRERSFRRLDGVPAGLITARYEGGMEPGHPAGRIDYDNGWFGYRLTVTTTSFEALPPPQNQ